MAMVIDEVHLIRNDNTAERRENPHSLYMFDFDFDDDDDESSVSQELDRRYRVHDLHSVDSLPTIPNAPTVPNALHPIVMQHILDASGLIAALATIVVKYTTPGMAEISTNPIPVSAPLCTSDVFTPSVTCVGDKLVMLCTEETRFYTRSNFSNSINVHVWTWNDKLKWNLAACVPVKVNVVTTGLDRHFGLCSVPGSSAVFIWVRNQNYVLSQSLDANTKCVSTLTVPAGYTVHNIVSCERTRRAFMDACCVERYVDSIFIYERGASGWKVIVNVPTESSLSGMWVKPSESDTTVFLSDFLEKVYTLKTDAKHKHQGYIQQEVLSDVNGAVIQQMHRTCWLSTSVCLTLGFQNERRSIFLISTSSAAPPMLVAPHDADIKLCSLGGFRFAAVSYSHIKVYGILLN